MTLGCHAPRGSAPRAGLRGSPQSRSLPLHLKRWVDVCAALFVLVLTGPMCALIALAVKIDSSGPALFHQQRIGQWGRPFTIHKFRTMAHGAEGVGAGYLLEKNDARITRVGAILRRLRIDELPQLLNVLNGEMSLVGPRPTLAYQVARYNDYQRQRLQVKPGMTGWAWIHGQKKLTWPERIELDVWYVTHWSLALDIDILWQSLLHFPGNVAKDSHEEPDEISRLD
jgi:lipopolysaccharide/colanic/teichoic acid biosynthesis glycosyltransferase